MLVVGIERSQFEVGPGAMRTLEVTVANTGTLVEDVRLEVLGPAASWIAFRTDSVKLFPGTQEVVPITLTPPPSTPAGTLVTALKASSAVTGESAVEELTIEVAAVPRVALDIRPRTVTHASKSRHLVVVSNPGNGPAKVVLQAFEADNVLILDLARSEVTVPPGGEVEVPIDVKATDKPARRERLRRPFTVQATGVGTSVAVEGALEQRRKQVPLLALVGAGAVLAAVLAAVLLRGSGDNQTALRSANVSPGDTEQTAAGGAPVPGGVAAEGMGGRAGPTTTTTAAPTTTAPPTTAPPATTATTQASGGATPVSPGGGGGGATATTRGAVVTFGSTTTTTKAFTCKRNQSTTTTAAGGSLATSTTSGGSVVIASPSTITSVGEPCFGTAVQVDSGQIRYTAPAGFRGTDDFVFFHQQGSTKVTVTVS